MHLQTDKDAPPEELVELVGRATANRLYGDFKKGRNLRLAKALRDQGEVARLNDQSRHRGVDGIGQVMRRIAPSLKYEIIRLYGTDALHDDAFMDRLNRENNLNLKPAYERKATIIKPT